jgi:hypothetical protein
MLLDGNFHCLLSLAGGGGLQQLKAANGGF